MQVDGEKGSYRLSPFRGLEFYEKHATDHQRAESEFVQVGVPADFREGHDWNLFAHFVDCVQKGVDASPSFEDGVRCARILDAADRSIREGQQL